MSQVTLMIQPADVIALTTFDGNIDIDNLKPMIFIAQTTHLKSFLGLALYNKIYTDFVAETLAGEYLIIFDDYIKDFLSYYTSVLFVDFGGYKVSENGLHKVTGENMQTLDASETEKITLRYNQLIAGVESNFKEYVSDKNLPELADKTITIETTMPWR
jgi:hypothetical protein